MSLSFSLCTDRRCLLYEGESAILAAHITHLIECFIMEFTGTILIVSGCILVGRSA